MEAFSLALVAVTSVAVSVTAYGATRTTVSVASTGAAVLGSSVSNRIPPSRVITAWFEIAHAPEGIGLAIRARKLIVRDFAAGNVPMLRVRSATTPDGDIAIG